jgi:hypothetical protein
MHERGKDNIIVLLTISGLISPSAQSLRDFSGAKVTFPAPKRRDCGAPQCASNFGLKIAGRLNSLWRRIGGSGDWRQVPPFELEY